MFDSKRIERLEQRILELERLVTIDHPTETEPIVNCFGLPLIRARRIEIREVLAALLNYLKVDVETTPATGETLTVVKQGKK